MTTVQLKLKQASAVLGVSPKDLQNLVQFGIVRPAKRADIYWFDNKALLLAKVAFHVRDSLKSSTQYLARMAREISRLDLTSSDWEALVIESRPAEGKAAVEVKVPLRELKQELQDRLPLAEIYRDVPRGRKRPGWKREFLATLQGMGKDIGNLSEQEIAARVRTHRSQKKRQPEMRVVAQRKKKTA